MNIASHAFRWSLVFGCLLAELRAAEANLTKLHEFGGPVQSAQRGLIEGSAGTLFGWDANSDVDRRGMIFRVNTDGTGFTTLHAFAGTAEDGDYPARQYIKPQFGSL